MSSPTISATSFVQQLERYYHESVVPYALGTRAFEIPKLTFNDLITLITAVRKQLTVEPTMLKISSPLFVVGDLHGQLLDLIRIFAILGSPHNAKFLFLGDIVDRGQFSLECITFIYAMKILYPQNVFIIRGNHEFEAINTNCGFKDEIVREYGNSLIFDAFNESFSFMPLAALIDNQFLCVHGGLGPSFKSIQQLETLSRPIKDFGSDLISSITWSDPSNSMAFYESSNRGTGYQFGEAVTEEFLKNNNLVRIIRGHECVMEGAETKFGVTTVFSASNYCGVVGNVGAVLQIKSPTEFEVHKFAPLPLLKRERVFVKREKSLLISSQPLPRLTTVILPKTTRVIIRHRGSDPNSAPVRAHRLQRPV